MQAPGAVDVAAGTWLMSLARVTAPAAAGRAGAFGAVWGGDERPCHTYQDLLAIEQSSAWTEAVSREIVGRRHDRGRGARLRRCHIANAMELVRRSERGNDPVVRA